MDRFFSPVKNTAGKITQFFFQVRFFFFSLFRGFLVAGILATALTLFGLSFQSTDIAAIDYPRTQWYLYALLALISLVTIRRHSFSFQFQSIREQLNTSGSPCAALTLSALLACIVFVTPSLFSFLLFHDLSFFFVPMVLFESIAVLTFFSLFTLLYSRQCKTLHLLIGMVVVFGFWLWGQNTVAYLLTIPLNPFRLPDLFMEPEFFKPATLVINRLFMLVASYLMLRFSVSSTAWGRSHSTEKIPEGTVAA